MKNKVQGFGILAVIGTLLIAITIAVFGADKQSHPKRPSDASVTRQFTTLINSKLAANGSPARITKAACAYQTKAVASLNISPNSYFCLSYAMSGGKAACLAFLFKLTPSYEMPGLKQISYETLAMSRCTG